MSFFQSLFKPSVPKVQTVATSPAVAVLPVPQHLPKIVAPTAAQIAKTASPSPAAQQWLAPQQTPSQYLNVLQEKQMGDEMVKIMAHGLPDREGVWWAVQSAQRVSEHLPPSDLLAVQAALNWVKNPTPETSAAANAAAANTDYRGPGAWAAQAAAWAQTDPSATPPPGQAKLPRLTPNAVAGAVLLTSSIAAHPQLASPKYQLPTVASPNLAGPDLSAPSFSTPQPGAPEFNTPNLSAPSAPSASLQTPQFSAPSLNAPGFTAPDMAAPNLATPNLQAPQFSGAPPTAPNLAAPSLSAPSLPNTSMGSPALPTSSLAVPNVSAPQFSLSQPSAPSLNAPNLSTPDLQAPQWDAPQVALPPVPPAVKAKVFKDQYSFISLGIDIAAGQNVWA